jgi:hypothetical protein
MNRYSAMGALLLLSLAVVASGFASRTPDPVYAGRPVGDWLDCGYEQLALALHETGPTAAPVIFYKLRREHPEYGFWAKYRRVWGRVPSVIRPWLPAPRIASFDDQRACSALLEIGPSVIPTLAIGLKDSNAGVRLTCALAVGCFRQRGSNIRPAIHALTHAQHDSNAEVRRVASLALGT